MNEWIWKEAMLDTDFALKLGEVNKFTALEAYIPKMIQKLYIHRYVYENEILVPRSTKDQIDNLISLDQAQIVDAETLLYNSSRAFIYQQTIHQLEKTDSLTRPEGKNWGEVISIAYAFASGIPFLLSDESDLQALLDDELNSGTDKDIQVVRLGDFIMGMKDKGFPRKDAYLIWCCAHRHHIEWAKNIFHKDMWVR
ncbi:hypothetical protein [Aureibacillus halotolerans]|nr:hypothetical protein [Aureibacillus halotolerans]